MRCQSVAIDYNYLFWFNTVGTISRRFLFLFQSGAKNLVTVDAVFLKVGNMEELVESSQGEEWCMLGGVSHLCLVGHPRSDLVPPVRHVLVELFQRLLKLKLLFLTPRFACKFGRGDRLFVCR